MQVSSAVNMALQPQAPSGLQQPPTTGEHILVPWSGAGGRNPKNIKVERRNSLKRHHSFDSLALVNDIMGGFA
jgi:hypothetical protein